MWKDGNHVFWGVFLKLKLLRSLVPRIELNKSIQDQETPFYDLEVLGNALLFFEKKKRPRKGKNVTIYLLFFFIQQSVLYWDLAPLN